MTSNEGGPGPLTPVQAAQYKKLRNLIFGVGAVLLLVLVTYSMRSGDMHAIQQRSHLDSTGRASVLAISTMAGLAFCWFAAKAIAKNLVRGVK